MTSARTATKWVAAGLLAALATPGFAQSLGSCDGRMFLSQGAAAGNTSLYRADQSTNPFTYPTIGTGGHRYNALGYHPTDNYLYGISTSSRELLRVNADGSTTSLGNLTGLPVGDYNAGTFDNVGNFYVRPSTSNNRLYRIDIDAMTATLITMTGGGVGGSIVAADLAWVNGMLYTITNDTGRLYAINPGSGALTAIGPAYSLAVSGSFGALFGAPNGLFASGNNGGFYQIDLTNGARTLISASPSSSNNDGANCPTANLMFRSDLSMTKTNTPASGPNDQPNDTWMPGETRTYTIVVGNAGLFGASGVKVSDPLPAGITAASWTCSGTGGGTCTASGSGGINDTVTLPVGASVTYQMTFTVPTTHTGALTNTATVTPGPTTTDPDTTNNTATDTDTPHNLASLSISKTNAASEVPTAGSTTYAIVVSNTGGTAVSNAVVRDDWRSLPQGGLDCSAGPLSCSASGAPGTQCPAGSPTPADLASPGLMIPSLPPGGVVSFTLGCKVTATGR